MWQGGFSLYKCWPISLFLFSKSDERHLFCCLQIYLISCKSLISFQLFPCQLIKKIPINSTLYTTNKYYDTNTNTSLHLFPIKMHKEENAYLENSHPTLRSDHKRQLYLMGKCRLFSGSQLIMKKPLHTQVLFLLSCYGN